MRKTNLLFLLLSILVGNVAFAQSDNDSCHCKEVIKSFKYFEKAFYRKKEYFHYPKEAVVVYDNGIKSTPPINMHIQTMLDFTPVKITPTSDLLIYRITETEIKLWEDWLKLHCRNKYNQYRKNHHYQK